MTPESARGWVGEVVFLGPGLGWGARAAFLIVFFLHAVVGVPSGVCESAGLGVVFVVDDRSGHAVPVAAFGGAPDTVVCIVEELSSACQLLCHAERLLGEARLPMNRKVQSARRMLRYASGAFACAVERCIDALGDSDSA